MNVVDEEFQNQVFGSGFDHNSKVVIRNGDDLLDDDGKPKRTGTMWTASAHIVTAIVGSGVLSLTWAIAQLGWITGVGTLLIFTLITLYTSSLLADCYRYPDPINGKRNHSYMESVQSYLGGTNYIVCGLLQYGLLTGTTIGYTITSSISMVAIRKSNCFHQNRHGALCKFSTNTYMVSLGIVEVLLSQIPSFHKLAGLSFVASTMSFGYAFIGTGLAFAKVISGKGGITSMTGVEIGGDISTLDKTWRMFTAIGDIAFACAYSLVLIEVQDTIKSNQPENKVMKKANMIGMSTATTLYLLCGCFGYAAFGNNAPGNMLTGFGFYEPFWLIDLANIFIVVHLIGAYQVLAQPVFNVVETWASMKWSKSKFIMEEHPLTIGTIELNMRINLFRLIWRTIFVIITTILAMTLPFFNDILALLGAIGYWPMNVYFPVSMHIAQLNIRKGSIKWIGLQLLNLICFLVAFAAAIGSIQGLSKALRNTKPFQFEY